MPLNTLFSLTVNEVIDEAEACLPRTTEQFKVRIKSRSDIGEYIRENHPIDLLEAGIAKRRQFETMCDIFMQGLLGSLIDEEKSKEYEKVTKVKNLKKLQDYGKDIAQALEKEYGFKNSYFSYEKVIKDIAFLLNHQVLMAKILTLNLEAFMCLLEDVEEEVSSPPSIELSEDINLTGVEKVLKKPKIPTPLSLVREKVNKQKEELEG